MPAITSLLIIGAGLGVAAHTARGDKRRRTDILRTVAQRRRGVLETGGWFGNPLVSVAHDDGVTVRVLMASTRHGRYSEYNATLPTPGLPTFSLTPPRLLDAVGRALGSSDTDEGVSTTDGAFVVKGDDPPVVRRVWRDPRARAFANSYPPARLESFGTRLLLLTPFLQSVEEVEACLDLLLVLARSDPFGHEALAGLADAELRHDRDGFREVVLPGPSPIVVGPQLRQGRVRTCVRTEAFGAVADDAATQVTALGATLEHSARELAICWPSIEADAQRLTAAIALLRRLASGPSLGVFR